MYPIKRSHYRYKTLPNSRTICTALDKLSEVKLPGDISPGDWIAFHQAGAYGFTEAMPFFLCHDLPAESIYYNGNFMTPRISKTSADWMI